MELLRDEGFENNPDIELFNILLSPPRSGYNRNAGRLSLGSSPSVNMFILLTVLWHWHAGAYFEGGKKKKIACGRVTSWRQLGTHRDGTHEQSLNTLASFDFRYSRRKVTCIRTNPWSVKLGRHHHPAQVYIYCLHSLWEKATIMALSQSNTCYKGLFGGYSGLNKYLLNLGQFSCLVQNKGYSTTLREATGYFAQ